MINCFFRRVVVFGLLVGLLIFVCCLLQSVFFHKEKENIVINNIVHNDQSGLSNYKIIPAEVIASSQDVVKIETTFEVTYYDEISISHEVLSVRDENFSGSGFITKSGKIVTARHVVFYNAPPDLAFFGASASAKLKSILVRDVNDRERRAKILKSDKKNDIAVLSINKSFTSCSGLDLNTEKLEKYDTFWATGYPYGDSGLVITPPQIYYETQDAKNNKESGLAGEILKLGYQKIMRFSGGSGTGSGISGGPILDKNGKVVGIFIVGDYPSGNMCYAVPSEYIKKMLDKLD